LPTAQGGTISTINSYISKGLPRDIDLPGAKAWVARYIDPHRVEARKGAKPGRPRGVPNRRAAPATDPGEAPRPPLSAGEARTAKLTHEAGIAALKLAERRASLVDRAACERAIVARARYERDSWNGWTSRAAPALATKLGIDAALVFGALDALVRGQPWEGPP
jgi:hypothetical protein